MIGETIQMKIDIDLLQNINSNLIEETMTVNMPTNACYFSNQAEDDVCWVWSAFVPPGIVTLKVVDPLNGVFQDNLIVGQRQKDIKCQLNCLKKETN